MASSSSSRNWVYDVFPSFSGEDVRLTFLSHFLKELDRKLIITFKDNELERSQSLDPELKQAIRTSRIAVVVFSEKYVSSSWCMDELLEIVKCKEELGQLVIPVFYGLDPSHVRKQTGKFGEAFVKTCQRKTEDEAKLWRKSLNDVANVLGYHSQNWPNEAKMIEAIANDVLGKLNFTHSKDFDDFFGMEDHIAKMSVLLHLESDEVRMVGIWGSSGIGKTSIARGLYNQLSHRFQGSIFIDRAFLSKSTSIYDSANPDDYNMKLYLLRNFLSEILDKKDLRINHLGAVREMLNKRKVLIFIDDLDDQMVLDTLVGQTQWFGCGSRIIVITKDKKLLRDHGIDHVYEVCLPSKELAFKIFCRSAFRNNFPPYGLMELASEVVLCAGNLPLGLKVLGSYLRGRDKDDLVDILSRLRNGLDGKIEKTLRVSYNGLDNRKDKAIFRYIACMFNGEKVNNIKLLLVDSGLDVGIGLKNLVDKSLIHVREEVVIMHSLLQEMGKEIVRAQSNEPGEREFLGDAKDICDLLEDNTGTKKVLGITLNMDEIDELHIHENAFKEMRNLLFLKIYTKKGDQNNEARWHLPEGFNYLPHKLRLLRLDGYPMRYMPSNFHTENLVKLHMPGSKLERLWEGVHSLKGLKVINLQGSRNLKGIPDLSMAKNLEELNLADCSSLVELPSSIQYLNKLEKLFMEGCINLEILPTGINLQSLLMLDLQRCSRIKIFPDISTNISDLYLDETSTEEFPSNLRLDHLITLRMRPMKSEKLWGRVQPLTPLMAILPHSLERLYLSNIPSLVEIPSSIQNFRKLGHLDISECINLEILSTGINLRSLETLSLSGCSRLKTFPNISTNIENLVLNRTGIDEVPWWIENFKNLEYITMEKCKNLRRVSLNIYKLESLVANFSDCGSLTEASWNGSPSEVAMATETIHSKLPTLEEGFYSDPYSHPPKVWFSFNFLNMDPEALLRQRLIFTSMILSGEEVPSYFPHRTTEFTLTNIPLLQTSLSQQFFKFKACAVVSFDSLSKNWIFGVFIRVNCRFKDRFGNSLDTFGHPQSFIAEKDTHLLVLNCLVPLNKDNAPLAQQNYDHVDMQIHIIKFDPLNKDEYTFNLKEWGVRLVEECSSPEHRLPHVCEADEDNLVNKIEHSEECVETVVKRQREIGSDFRLREGPVVLPVLMEQQDTRIGGHGESLQCLSCWRDIFRIWYRTQTGDFGKIFEETCKNKTEEVKNQWKRALTDVANILGYHSVTWGNEAMMIEEITNDVLGKLLLTTSKDSENLVGIEDHIAEMSKLLQMESEEVRMVGIWGSSGIGKTTIARALFNRLSRRFQGRIFIDRAFVFKSMEIYGKANPDDYNMKLHLQGNFLSEILGKHDIKIDHLNALGERLKNQKVLIVIDDLDDHVVLDALVGQTQWFGSGSRIIVVTSDKHLLKAHGIDHIYEVCLPSEKLALEMFCRYAFKQSYPPDGFEKLVVEVARHAGSLPLGLNVLGSSLRGRDKDYWTDMLPRLQSGLGGKIEKTLRVSYDGLGSEEDKAIFRHIACLFNYVEVTYMKLLLADSGLGVNIALEILADKSLIYIRFGNVEMHRLLQEMGRNIVRIQSIDKPEKREFLIDSKDVCDVLSKNIGTRKVLGIELNLHKIDELHIHENAFRGMCNLRFLEFEPRISYLPLKKQGILHLPESFDYLPPRLKLLCWPKYPMRYMPSTFHPECLVKLKMQDSKLEKLWEGVVSLTFLKEMDMEGSKDLKEIPNLSMAVNLEKLILNKCSSLVELPSSIQNLNKLERLSMRQCSNLETLPVGMNLKSLNWLYLKGCSRLKNFPEISTNISVVYLDETAIEKFPSDLHLENVSQFSMTDLKSEKLWEGVQPLTPLLSMLSSSLTWLSLSHIPSLVEIPSSIQIFTKLDHLGIQNCINLETLPIGIDLESLSSLNLAGCLRLRTFPDISTNISDLYLQRTGIEEVPWWIKNFSKLKHLYMNGCSKLQRVSLHISKLKHLEMVHFLDCMALTEASWNESSRVVPMSPLVNDKASPSFPNDFIKCFEGKSTFFKYLTLSGVEVPSFFTQRSTGTSLTNIPLLRISPFQPFFSFKACAVVDPTSSLSYSSFSIFVSCRFTDRFGNHFDTPFRRHIFQIYEKGIYLVIFDCFVSLKEHNNSIAERNYDQVDIQFHLRNGSKSTLILKEWGVRIFNHSAKNRLGMPNTLPHVETKESRKRKRIM